MRIAGLTLAYWAVLAAPAVAQVAPPIEDVVVQGEILNRSVGSAIEMARTPGQERSDELAGEAGLYVLNVNEIFYVSATGGLGYTSNPTRTNFDAGGEVYGDLGVSAGIATRLAGTVDFGAALNIEGREFEDNDQASSRSVSATVGAGRALYGPVYGSATLFGGYAFDRDLHDSTSFYGVSASLSAALPVSRRLIVRPGVNITQQWSGVAENESFTASGSIDVLYSLSPKWMVSARASLAKRWYDDFYEDVTFVKRKDDTAAISASLAWLATRDITLVATLEYEDQNSTFFLSNFHAAGAGLTISSRLRF